MNRFKRLLTLLLCAVMLFTILSACGGTDEASEEPTAQPTVKPTEGIVETEPPEASIYPLTTEDVTFTLFYTHQPAYSPYMDTMADNPSFQAAEDITGVNIEFIPANPSTESEAFNLMINSGEYYDFLTRFTRRYKVGGEDAIENEIIVDLMDYIEYLPNYTAILDSDESMWRDLLTENGKMVSVDGILDSYEVPSIGPMARGDWLEALNLDIPETYDDYYNMLTAFYTEYNAQMTMLRSGVAFDNFLIAGYGVAGYQTTDFAAMDAFYQVDGTVSYGMVQPEFKEYLTMMNQWYGEGLINSDVIINPTIWPSADNQQLVYDGKSGLWWAPADQITGYASLSGDENFKAVGIYDAVKNSGDQTHLGGGGDSYVNTGGGVAISTSCKDIQLAVQWMDFWFSEEGRTLGTYGVEDISYTVDNSGAKVFTDLILNHPDGIGTGTTRGLYTGWAISLYVDISTLLYDYMDESYVDALKTWSANKDTAYELPSRLTLNADEQSSLGIIMSEVRTLCSEYVLGFITGSISLDQFDYFTEMIYSMNIDEAIAIYQNALERYYS